MPSQLVDAWTPATSNTCVCWKGDLIYNGQVIMRVCKVCNLRWHLVPNHAAHKYILLCIYGRDTRIDAARTGQPWSPEAASAPREAELPECKAAPRGHKGRMCWRLLCEAPCPLPQLRNCLGASGFFGCAQVRLVSRCCFADRIRHLQQRGLEMHTIVALPGFGPFLGTARGHLPVQLAHQYRFSAKQHSNVQARQCQHPLGQLVGLTRSQSPVRPSHMSLA